MKYKNELFGWGLNQSIYVSVVNINDFKVHLSRDFEVLLVLDGSITLNISDQKITGQKDDLIFINCNQLYKSNFSDEDNLILSLKVNPAFFNGSLNKVKGISLNGIIDESSSEKKVLVDSIRHLIASIVFEMNNRNLGYNFRVGAYIYRVGEILAESQEGEEVINDSSLEKLNVSRLQGIIDYINNNYKSKLTLKDIAENENLNYSYLSQFIRNSLGISFQEYLNKVRLEEALSLLINTNESITDISNSSGFSNIGALNNLFKKEYGTTPFVYRREYNAHTNDKMEKNNEIIEKDKTNVLKLLEGYFDDSLLGLNNKSLLIRESIEVSYTAKGTRYRKHWQEIINYETAVQGLSSAWQRHFLKVQKDLKFKYIHINNLFCKDMKIYNLKNNEVMYNWFHVDELFDFFINNKIKPIIDIDFLNKKVKAVDENLYIWTDNTLPESFEAWLDLIINFITHSIERYGEKEVSTWFFEISVESYGDCAHDAHETENNLNLFKETLQTIQAVSKVVKVGGPSLSRFSAPNYVWFKDFIEFIISENLDIDFLSLNIYSEHYQVDQLKYLIEKAKNEEEFKKYLELLNKRYHRGNYLKNEINKLNNYLTVKDRSDISIYITEWSGSSIEGSLINDTVAVAPFIIKNMLQTINKVDALGFLNISDLFEDYRQGGSNFHGGVGLLNKNGLKKPSYNAFYLLAMLGREVLITGEGYIVTKSCEGLQILTYNYAELDDLYAVGELSHIEFLNRYNVYKAKEDSYFDLIINDIFGTYEISTYQLNRHHGSVYDEWVKIGAPEEMDKDQLNLLKLKEKPKITVETIKLEGRYQKDIMVPIHGVEMITLNKISNKK